MLLVLKAGFFFLNKTGLEILLSEIMVGGASVVVIVSNEVCNACGNSAFPFCIPAIKFFFVTPCSTQTCHINSFQIFTADIVLVVLLVPAFAIILNSVCCRSFGVIPLIEI